MQIVILVVILIVTLAMIGLILLQRSEGGGLGVGSGNMGGLMTTRGTSDMLTRTTAILATIFMALCLLLAILSGRQTKEESILSAIAAQEEVDSATLKQQAEGKGALVPADTQPQTNNLAQAGEGSVNEVVIPSVGEEEGAKPAAALEVPIGGFKEKEALPGIVPLNKNDAIATAAEGVGGV